MAKAAKAQAKTGKSHQPKTNLGDVIIDTAPVLVQGSHPNPDTKITGHSPGGALHSVVLFRDNIDERANFSVDWVILQADVSGPSSHRVLNTPYTVLETSDARHRSSQRANHRHAITL